MRHKFITLLFLIASIFWARTISPVSAALPDYVKGSLGTAVVWGYTGATGEITVTHVLNLDGLADAAGRMGTYADLGATWDQDQIVTFWIETNTAPTAGATYALY